jgi:hypothetical protein
MNKVFVSMISISLLLLPLIAHGQSEPLPAGIPPIAQLLIPEGDFALKLVPALKLGTPDNEAQAEDMLTSVGIAPKNGWIADYPMTPVVIGQLQDSVIDAVTADKLPMEKEEALKAFQDLTTELGLAIVPGSEQYAENQPPTSSEYVQPPVVNDYYYEEGPPVVTYYPPPPDYSYLYAWVPYPFWWSDFFFPGFFVLNDFDIIVAGHHHHHHPFRISNHFRDPKTHSVFRADPRARTFGRPLTTSHSHTSRFDSPEARSGAQSIFERSHAGQMGTMNPTLQGPSRQQFPANRGVTGPSTTGRGTISSRFRNPGSFGFQTNMGGHSKANIQRPSRSFGGSFGGSHGGGFGSFHSGGLSGSSHGGSFGGFHSGGFAGGHGGGRR